jgi:SAM-dependent methyltransferase
MKQPPITISFAVVQPLHNRIHTSMNYIKQVTAQVGYDLWSETYDETPNPVVALDARYTLAQLAPQADERILDAGCGTGRNLQALLDAGALPTGIDFSPGMLAVAQRKFPNLDLRQADLQQTFPFANASFNATLCALIGEHLRDLHAVCREVYRVVKPGGRFVFSVYHPWLALAGKEANFDKDGWNYRLGAYTHTTADYLAALNDAGFTNLTHQEYFCDEALAATIERAQKYLGKPLLLVIRAVRPE